MCTYQIISILNRNATTRNLVGKLTVWLYISLKDVSDTCNVQFNAISFINLVVCLFAFSFFPSFLPSFIFTTEVFKSFAQIHITESNCRM